MGFDFLKNYPENGLPEALAKRITWLQGNLYVKADLALPPSRLQ